VHVGPDDKLVIDEADQVGTRDLARIRAGDREAMHDKAALGFLADYLAGKDTILLAGSNAEAADLARRVQDKLIGAGRV
jgi:hypothetical protein